MKGNYIPDCISFQIMKSTENSTIQENGCNLISGTEKRLGCNIKSLRE